MKIIGLTGNIGMGKSTVAKAFAELGVPVCDADAIVHSLIRHGGEAVAPVAALFPESLEEGAINRKKLGEVVFADPEKRKQLEAILHPLVRKHEEAFIETQKALGHKVVILEIPLLFEVGAQARVDEVLVVSCPADQQKQRVMSREGMSEEKFQRIVAAQWPDSEKRAKADMVIDTGGTLESVQAQVKKIKEGWDA